MGSDTNSTTASPNGKRSRDHEDEVYVDNLHSHKRYLSEMMASSLNGLTVGESMHEAIMDSPARSESMFYLRDEMSLQYSPMSEDLDDVRYCETPMSACSSQSESCPTSPVSPYRYKPVGAFCYSPPGPSFTSNGCTVVGGPSQTRQRGSDTEGRLPSSPSDICHSSDLRKTALLRSVQMRTHVDVETRSYSYMKPLEDVREYHVDSCSYLGPSDSGFPVTQLSMRNTEAKSQSCSYMKPMDDEREYHVEGCSSMVSSEPGFSTMHNNETDTPSCSYMKPLEDEVGYHVERCSPMGSSQPILTETQEPTLSTEVEPLSLGELRTKDGIDRQAMTREHI